MSSQENIVEFPDLKAIEEEAALWVAMLDSRGEAGMDMGALKAWLDQGPQQREAFERMAALWLGADVLDALNYQDDVAEVRARTTRRTHVARWAVGIAATLLIAGMITMFQFYADPVTTQSARFATLVGDQQTVELVDGSRMILNTDSEVSVDLTEARREITLLRGEAHFDVAHDTERPFVVYARGGIVKAVGTAFTVHLKREKVEVTVTEGVVAILSRPEEPASDAAPVAIEALTPIAALTVGESAVIEEEAVESVVRMSDEALDRKLLWRGGFIAFAGEPLSSVVADVSRYTELEIVIDDPALEALPIGGYFRVGEVEDMFDSLETSFGIKVHRIGTTRVVLTRAS